MFLAVREIRRAKVRFGLLILAVGVLLALVVFLQALTSALVTQFTGAIEHQSAPVLVYGADARRSVAGSSLDPAVVEAVRGVDGVAAAGPVGVGTFTVRAGPDDALAEATLVGYELGGPGAPTTLADGRLPEADGEAVASASSDDGFELGDVVAVPDGPDVTIVGVGDQLRLGSETTLFTSFATFAEARAAADPGGEPARPSLVGVEPAEGVGAGELAARITEAVDGVEALDRATAVEEAPGVGEVRLSLGIVVATTLVAAVAVIGLFFSIVTVQRSRSLLVLKAVGAPTRTLLGSLLAQVVWVVAIGSLLGTVLVQGLVGGGGALEVEIGARLVGAVTGVLLVGGLAVTALVGLRIVRLDPADAVRGAVR